MALLRLGIVRFRLGALEAALESLIGAEAALGDLSGTRDRVLTARTERVIVLTALGRHEEALSLLDVVLFDLSADTPGLAELAYSLLAMQTSLCERLEREEQVRAVATAFVDRLGPGASQNQRYCSAMTLWRRGRVAYVMGDLPSAVADVCAGTELLAELGEAGAGELAAAAVMGAWMSQQSDRPQEAERLLALIAPPLDGAATRLLIHRQQVALRHRRVHWLISHERLGELDALTRTLVAELEFETDEECRRALRDSLQDVYGAFVAAERPDQALGVLDQLFVLLHASDDSIDRGRATVFLAVKALLLRTIGRPEEAVVLTDGWKGRVGPETWQAIAAMLAHSCAVGESTRAQQRAGFLLIRAMMLDELGRQDDAAAGLRGFVDQFRVEDRDVVGPFLAVADAALAALDDGRSVADVLATAEASDSPS